MDRPKSSGTLQTSPSRRRQQQSSPKPANDRPPHRTPSTLVLAIDIGSSSTRCSVFGWESNSNDSSHRAAMGYPSLHPQVPGCTRKIRAIHPTTGRLHNVRGILDAVEECVQDTLERLRDHASSTGTPFEVVAVGFSSLVMNLVGVDEVGEPLGDDATLSYACHISAVNEEVQALKRELGDERLKELYCATGSPLHTAYAVAQLRVLYADYLDICQDIAQWQTLASCCLTHWLGLSHLPVSFSEASWTGLLNNRTCKYEPAVLDLLPDDCCQALPELADFDQPNILLQGLSPHSSPFYDQWPELRSARFFLGVGDGACATVGSKCTVAARISCTVGTSAAARVCLPLPMEHSDGSDSHGDSPGSNGVGSREKRITGSAAAASSAHPVTFVPGLFCHRIDRSHVVLGGALTDGGSVMDWAKQLLNLESSPEAYENCLSEVEELAEEDWVQRNKSSSNRLTAASSPALTFVPFLGGERSPGFRDAATGAVLGLTRATRPAHLFKACLEGVTLRMNTIVSLLLQAVGSSDARIIASGKALESNALWRQMLADCTGVPVVFDEDTTESTSRGVACLMAAAMGFTEGLSSKPNALALETVKPSKMSKPRPVMAPYWNRAAQEQERLLAAVSPLYGET